MSKIGTVRKLMSGTSKGKFQACLRRPDGTRITKVYPLQRDAEAWLAARVAEVRTTGRAASSREAATTLRSYSALWLASYNAKPATVRSARGHLRVLLDAGLGDIPMSQITPTMVRGIMKRLVAKGYSISYAAAVRKRLSQVMNDAIDDGTLGVRVNPVRRKDALPAGRPRAFVATDEQVGALYEAMPDPLKPAIALAAFCGLRAAECCGLRQSDVDWHHMTLRPKAQYISRVQLAEPLKSPASHGAIPMSREVTALLGRSVRSFGGPYVVNDGFGGPVSPGTVERHVRAARAQIEGLPATFRLHDLRHFFAAALIAEGLNVKEVQTRLRHAKASTTLDIYGHLFDARSTDERTRAAQTEMLRRCGVA